MDWLAGEIWLAAYLMGHTLTLWEVLMLKSLIGSLRGVAFFVPNGFGVQEGAYVVLGAVIGLPPDFALAVSLAIRARELIVSVPGMLAWQHIEGRAFWRKRVTAGRCRRSCWTCTRTYSTKGSTAQAVCQWSTVEITTASMSLFSKSFR